MTRAPEAKNQRLPGREGSLRRPGRGSEAAAGAAEGGDVTAETEDLQVWIDQDLCTGDGLCAQYAPEVFEFDVDGLAYVKDDAGELQLAPGSRVDVPRHLKLDVIDAARECPGECIHVLRSDDGAAVAGPDAA